MNREIAYFSNTKHGIQHEKNRKENVLKSVEACKQFLGTAKCKTTIITQLWLASSNYGWIGVHSIRQAFHISFAWSFEIKSEKRSITSQSLPNRVCNHYTLHICKIPVGIFPIFECETYNRISMFSDMWFGLYTRWRLIPMELLAKVFVFFFILFRIQFIVNNFPFNNILYIRPYLWKHTVVLHGLHKTSVNNSIWISKQFVREICEGAQSFSDWISSPWICARL